VRDEKLLHGQIGCAFEVRNEPDQPMGLFQSGFHAPAAATKEIGEQDGQKDTGDQPFNQVL